MPVAVVTDSTAYLPSEAVERYGIEVVPLYVVLAGRSGAEGRDVSPADVARTLSVRGQHVSTSRPTPGDFVAAYRRCLDAGADQLVDWKSTRLNSSHANISYAVFCLKKKIVCVNKNYTV